MKHKALQLAIPAFLSLTLLNGCTPYSESFDCPPGHGVGCKSLSSVNQMVEEGELPLEDRLNKITPSQKEPSQATQGQKTPSFKPYDAKESHNLIEANLIESRLNEADHSGPINLLSKNTSQSPSPESLLKIWIIGYEDEDGIYHAPSYVYASLKKNSPD